MSLPGVVWLVERPRECRPRLTLRLVFVGHAIWPSSHDIAGKRQEEVSEEPPPPVEWRWCSMVKTFRMHFSPFRYSSSPIAIVHNQKPEEEYSSPPCKDAKTINVTLMNDVCGQNTCVEKGFNAKLKSSSVLTFEN